MKLAGIHHITAIARDGRACIDFYCMVLGLRLVKVTVNYDDPVSYHIYFGDRRATPGTLLTFFLWPDAPRGHADRGQVERIAYAVPYGSSDYWRDRLRERAALTDSAGLTARDPDGMTIELIEQGEEYFRDVEPNTAPPADVAPEHAIGRFHGAVLAEADVSRTEAFLRDTLGLEPAGSGAEHRDVRLPDGGELRLVQRSNADRRGSAIGPGIVHHIAFRATDDEEQLAWRDRIMQAGIGVTQQRERTYFRSIYLREPGGVLFEIATMKPGMTADEGVEELGQRLMLPKWLEKDRPKIIAHLPTLVSPETGAPVATPIEV